MIVFQGYGIALVAAIYALIMFLTSIFFKTVGPQYHMVYLFGANFIATLINFIVAKFLNKNGVKHTVFDIRLETFVIIIGILFGLACFLY